MIVWSMPLVRADVLNVVSVNVQTLNNSPRDMESGYSRWQDKPHSAMMGNNAQRDVWRVMPVRANAIRSPDQVSRNVRVNMLPPPPVHKKNWVR